MSLCCHSRIDFHLPISNIEFVYKAYYSDRRKPRANHRSERKADTRLTLFVGSIFQRSTQIS